MNTLRVTLKQPINGFWDGGAKSTFDFELREIKQDDKGFYRKIDCWSGNHYFTIGAGKSKPRTNLQSLATVKRMILNGYFVKPGNIEKMELIEN